MYAFACTALLSSPLLPAFTCTALLDGTSFAVPSQKSLCFRSGFSLLPAFALHGSARCYTLRRSQDRKASAFAPAFLSCRPSPARLCSMLHSSPFPARKNEVFSGCGRSPYKKIGHLPFESKLSSALTDLFARLSAYPKFLILNSFSASRF